MMVMMAFLCPELTAVSKRIAFSLTERKLERLWGLPSTISCICDSYGPKLCSPSSLLCNNSCQERVRIGTVFSATQQQQRRERIL